jgi:Ca2+-transporting ATPase
MSDQQLGEFLLLLAVLFSLTYLFAGLLERLRIPGIIAALLVGIGMHYTPVAPLLGHAPFDAVFSALANLGVLFLLFFIGLQIDTNAMGKQGRDITLATVLNTLVPFAAGMGVMRFLEYDWMTAFVIGLACMPTAEAVIVPVLDEFNLIRTKVGTYIVGAGVLDDVIEVFLVALVSVWIGAQSGALISEGSGIVRIFANAVLFIAAAWVVHRIILTPLSHWLKTKVSNLIMLMIIVLFVFGGFAQYTELGLVVGAIVAGILMRPVFSASNKAGERAEKAVRAVSYGFFGIIFFLWIGLSVDLEGMFKAPELALLIFMAAFAGKLTGILLMVPMKKLNIKEAWTIGIGLNARLTTEIIVAKLLLDAELIDTQLFTALVAVSSLSTLIVPLAFSLLVLRWSSVLRR